MAQFNNKELFNIQLKRDIEDYFTYRWDQDKYKVINPDQNINYLQQVPEFVEDNLLTTFLFEEFMTNYQRTFNMPKIGPNSH